MIERSEILKRYWNIFKNEVNACDLICCIGYSGNDPHINEAIRTSYNDCKKIFILEYYQFKDNDYNPEFRKLFWESQFNHEITLKLEEKINDFDIKKWLQ